MDLRWILVRIRDKIGLIGNFVLHESSNFIFPKQIHDKISNPESISDRVRLKMSTTQKYQIWNPHRNRTQWREEEEEEKGERDPFHQMPQ